MSTYGFTDNGLYREDFVILGATPITTNDATPIVVFSIPTVINKGYLVTLKYAASVPGSAPLKYAGTLFAGYGRDSGNITKIDRDILTSITGFSGSGNTPNIQTVANVANQTIDVVITGRAATTLNWKLKITWES